MKSRDRWYLHAQGSVLDFRRALSNDEGDAVLAVFCRLREVDAEKMKPPLQLLVTALDGQRFQALLVAGQGTLNTNRERS